MTDQPSDRDRDKLQQQTLKPEELSSSESTPWWVQALLVGLFGMVFALGVAYTIFGIFKAVFMGTLFSMFGLLFLGGTVYLCVETLPLVRRGVSAEGIVVGFDERMEDQEEGERKYSIVIGPISWSFGPKEERYVTFFPRVQFETKDHEKRVFTSDDGSRKPSYRVGEVVRVLYDPARPQVARINKHLWAPIVAGVVIGAIFLLPGLWYLLAGFGFLSDIIQRE